MVDELAASIDTKVDLIGDLLGDFGSSGLDLFGDDGIDLGSLAGSGGGNGALDLPDPVGSIAEGLASVIDTGHHGNGILGGWF
jgi:hypothetical protein